MADDEIHLWEDTDALDKILTVDGAEIAFDPDCCCECCQHGDEFNRADSTDLGSDWDERSGDWSISSNQLYEAGTAGAMVIFQPNCSHPRMLAYVTIEDETQGDIYRLIVNYLDDDNFMYAEYEVGASPSGTISLYSVSGGVGTELRTENVVLTGYGGIRIFTVCLSSQTFSAHLSNVSAYMCVWEGVGPTHATGYKAGLGNGAAQDILYDHFLMSEHWEDNDKCPECCPCRCGDNEIPRDLLATYYGEPDCDTLDGIVIPITNEIGNQEWIGELDDCTGAASELCCEALLGLELTLNCGSPEDVTTWSLGIDNSGCVTPGKGCNYATLIYADAASTCDPLNLIFKTGPGYPTSTQCPNPCWNCGRQNGMPPFDELFHTEYSIIVTEAP